MTLLEQAARRVELAHQIGARPVRWVATSNIAVDLGTPLYGLPIEIGAPRSEWGLDLVLAPS